MIYSSPPENFGANGKKKEVLNISTVLSVKFTAIKLLRLPRNPLFE